MATPGAAPAQSFDFFLCCADPDREAAEALQTALLARSPGRSYFWIPPPASGPSVEQSLESLLRRSHLVVALVTSNTEPEFFDRFEIRRAAELAEADNSRVVALMIDVGMDLLGLLDQLGIVDRLDARSLGSTRAVADTLCQMAGVSLPERKPPSIELIDELERLLQYRSRHAKNEAKAAAVVPRIDQLAQEIALGAEANTGDLVAGARLVQPLGSDSFSYTWYAKREVNGEPCITKIFRLERLTSGMMLWGFRQAVRALQTLNEHPHVPRSVVRLLDVSSDTLAFTTEYLPEGTLEHVASRSWPIERRVGLFTQVCAAVEFAHDLGIVHGDIKPSNIALNADGRAVLTDFALSAPRLIPESSKSYARVAAPMYMSPELRDEEATESSDIYSLGRLLYYLLIERTPPPQLEAEPKLESLERFPPSLVAIVRRATRLDPAHRYVSVKEMLADLEVHRTGGTVIAVAPAQAIRRSSFRFSWKNPAVVMGAVAAFAVALAFWSVLRPRPPAPDLPPVLTSSAKPGTPGTSPTASLADTQPTMATATRPGSAPAVEAGSCVTSPLRCERQEWTDPQGMVFVRVCAGSFCMGSADGDSEANNNERPAHGVGVPEFWIGKEEVSVGRYRQVNKGVSGADDMPVTGITWDDADRFCRGLGHRLPSETEWEYAARGTDGRHYPWGNEVPGPGRAAFGRQHGAPDYGPSPVSSFPVGAGPFGTLHQAGNVSEWVADCFDARIYRTKAEHNLTDANAAVWTDCVVHTHRGGSFSDPVRKIRAAARFDASRILRTETIGFRCAR